MRIFVTGGAGFIGSQYVRALLSGELPGTPAGAARVTVLDVLGHGGDLRNLAPVSGHPGLTFVRGDIRDAQLVDEVVRGHDAIVHFAAESHVDRSIEDAHAFVSTNVLGTQVLLDAARRHGVGRFAHVSTDEVYGSIPVGSWTEEQPLAPNSPYAASKAGSDLLVLAAHRTHGLDTVITRCSNNYGPHQDPEKVIPRFVTNLLRGRRVPLYGEGANVREWLHVADHCAAVHLALRNGRSGHVYNVGGGTELTNRELTALLLEICGSGWDMVERVADRLGHDQRYSLDMAKIRRELGFTPRQSFDTGLKDTVEWYRENASWWNG
ncbi:dTDP-glucose 4,6-dehydratase [Streptomyces nitrosporeus]|uniref:dTDP-glucose 4,6-dehydratase n=1 Tax=Streptomyces nitrosporeus TaxID=28894 RepID=A0A5J6FD16_9ACTN|nr:dTDP-glucose 4,6-dehydratase [Streptomyces nitrosporeus]QEU73963.1 dTDP-glucose 4,6-dehydratase [Streptomyces nitrosporeus]GGZ00917.1 dTDP-glucose 4,6-dehydratase [Streptomyces nitrosporeus]